MNLDRLNPDARLIRPTRIQAVSYSRVSSTDQEREGFSIPAQRRLLKEYAEANNVLIVEEFNDVETARASGRTGFTKMLAYLKQHRRSVRAILVEKTDRLYRNITDWAVLDEFGVSIHLVKENVIIGPESRSSDQFIHGIKVLMARNYSLNLSEETIKGMTEKARAGIYPSCAPFGYLNIEGPDGKRIIVPHPSEGPVVTELFAQFATGNYSLKSLVEHSRESGVLVNGRMLYPSILHNTLRKRLYSGDFDWKSKLYQGTHEAIVTRETWSRVQEILDGRKKTGTARARPEFPFSGFIKCGHCGCSMVAELKKGKYVYYHCTGHRGKCPEPYTRQEVLVDEFSALLSELVIPSEVLEWLAEVVNSTDQAEAVTRERSRKSKESELSRLTYKLQILYDDRLEGRLPVDLYDQKASSIDAQRREARRQLSEMETATKPALTTVLELARLTSTACMAFRDQPDGEKRRLLSVVVKDAIWMGNRLQAKLLEPFEQLRRSNFDSINRINMLPSAPNAFENWLPEMDSNHCSRRQRPLSYR